MMNETTLTIVGNLTEAPELRFLPSGAARAGFTVASTPRRFDRQTGAWVDGEPLFLRCVAWGPLAEHTAESLGKGDRVVVAGRLRQRSFETAEGARRQVIELEVDELEVSLRYATARPQRTTRSERDHTEESGAESPGVAEGSTNELVSGDG
ncbi:MAG: single-stranded DNA-binding protein [Catenulispora sp.]